MNNTAANEIKELPAEGITQSQYMSDPFGENAAALNIAEDDRKLYVRFYMEPVYQEAESIIKERKIYKDTEYIEIRIPGDKQTCIQRQVFPSDRIRFSQQYERFTRGQAEQTVGTPLSNMPSIPASKVKEYEFFHIRTVEQLAECADNAGAAAIMGFHADKAKAQKFVSAAEGAAPVEELKKRMADQEEMYQKEIKSRDDFIKQLADRMEALEADQANAKVDAKAPAKSK